MSCPLRRAPSSPRPSAPPAHHTGIGPGLSGRPREVIGGSRRRPSSRSRTGPPPGNGVNRNDIHRSTPRNDSDREWRRGGSALVAAAPRATVARSTNHRALCSTWALLCAAGPGIDQGHPSGIREGPWGEGCRGRAHGGRLRRARWRPLRGIATDLTWETAVGLASRAASPGGAGGTRGSRSTPRAGALITTPSWFGPNQDEEPRGRRRRPAPISASERAPGLCGIRKPADGPVAGRDEPPLAPPRDRANEVIQGLGHPGGGDRRRATSTAITNRPARGPRSGPALS